MWCLTEGIFRSARKIRGNLDENESKQFFVSEFRERFRRDIWLTKM
jgi:hypothetical protein